LHYDFRASDVEERTSRQTSAHDLNEGTLACSKQTETYSEGRGTREDKLEPAHSAEIVREGLDERDTQGKRCCSLVNGNGNHYVEGVLELVAESKGQSFKDSVN